MAKSSPSLDWSLLDGTKYRCEDLGGDGPLWGDFLAVKMGNYAELALVKASKSVLALRTLGGDPLFDVAAAEIVGFGFTAYNQLVTVSNNGRWNEYSDYTGRFAQHTLPIEGQVAEAKFGVDGAFLARIQGSGDFILVKSKDDYVIHTLDSPPLNFYYAQDRAGNDLIIVEREGRVETLAGQTHSINGHVLHLAISPNLKLVAIVSSNGDLLVLDQTLALLSSHTVSLDSLSDVQWCGNDSIVLACADAVHIYGPTPNKFITIYPSNINPQLHSTPTGVFVSTHSSLQYISTVPEAMENVFGLGSDHPAAVLLDTLDLFEKGDPNLSRNLRLIENSLTLAVDTCISAAGECFVPFWQRKLLRAASFGKSYLPFYNATDFVQTCAQVQVLNNLRSPDVGIYLALSELQSLGIDHIVRLLLPRNLHSLAIQMCKRLNHPCYFILTHWAQAKILANKDMSDDELLDTITTKLNNEAVAWTEVAKFAHTEGRNYLAKKLVLLERSVWDRSRLLLDMGEPHLALATAAESYSTDTVIYILFNIKLEMSKVDFYKALNQAPFAQQIWTLYLTEFFPPRELTDFYYQNEDYLSLVKQGSLKTDVESYQKLVALAKTSTEDNMGRVVHALEAKLTAIDCQTMLAQSHDTVQVGEPVVTSIQKLFQSDTAAALALAKKCKVPNVETAQAFLNAITRTANEDLLLNLLDFSATTIGKSLPPEDYHTHLIHLGFKRHASLYIPKFSGDTRFKIRALLACDLHNEATALARETNDEEVLQALQIS